MPAKKRVIEVPDEPVDEPTDLRREDVASGAPEPPDDVTLRDTRPPEDGGVEQHPVHDDDLEDLQPEDYEELIDEAAEGGFDPTDKYEVEREAGRKPKDPGEV
jgi:hypothetical protein